MIGWIVLFAPTGLLLYLLLRLERLGSAQAKWNGNQKEVNFIYENHIEALKQRLLALEEMVAVARARPGVRPALPVQINREITVQWPEGAEL